LDSTSHRRGLDGDQFLGQLGARRCILASTLQRGRRIASLADTKLLFWWEAAFPTSCRDVALQRRHPRLQRVDALFQLLGLLAPGAVMIVREVIRSGNRVEADDGAAH
jgi:hypothetical protein